MAIKGSSKSSTCKKCYVTCRYRDKSEYKYFEWSSFYDIELKKKVLLASAAIPVIFESIEIDGEWFVDGGANGDNIPVKPLEKEDLDCIIIIHLSNNPATINNYKGDVIEIFPSKHLGGLIDGTLDFDSQSVNERIELGYYDTKLALMNLADLCYRFKKPEYVKVKSSTYKKKI
ncbi:hypothetical protein Q428_04630 [Fervidicella metallireducens AeB]|uniref:PNPLA domain-containing protein n=2 Tax=Fervidicella TaxID=1403538 RepID=A0A017RWR2_9CLOT|nr:patatin-like phospholipase family protein [Fervidicella metallireducens]EYE89097.1 hypothetical protein Q428_04630 [Fervidicella metallireducens AeB]